MRSQNYTVTRYDADPGRVFDWKEPHYREDEEGNQVREYLYAKTLFIGAPDTIDNYLEIDEPEV